MPNTCPYGGRRRHANRHYLTRQRHTRYLTLEEREIEYDHNNAGCDDVKPAAGLRAHLTKEEGVRSEACRDT
jgi:hypothetical protein